MRIIFIGDIVGKIGRKAVYDVLPVLKNKYAADLVIANGENATHGKGLSKKHYEYLLSLGIDVITLGNHYDTQKEMEQYIDSAPKLVRPYNLAIAFPGAGTKVFNVNGTPVRVTNIIGNAFINMELKPAYESINEIVNNSKEQIHIIDFHGETTGEKQAISYAFDGKVSAILGTHTHVQTNDEKILPGGTGFIADVGMCGAELGVLGFEKNSVINKTLLGSAQKFKLDETGDYIFNAVFLEINNKDGKTKKIEKIRIETHGKNTN
ncbi:MAG: TIGR00282 family metallophosphoesterase [Bacilli bacterium]